MYLSQYGEDSRELFVPQVVLNQAVRVPQSLGDVHQVPLVPMAAEKRVNRVLVVLHALLHPGLAQQSKELLLQVPVLSPILPILALPQSTEPVLVDLNQPEHNQGHLGLLAVLQSLELLLEVVLQRGGVLQRHEPEGDLLEAAPGLGEVHGRLHVLPLLKEPLCLFGEYQVQSLRVVVAMLSRESKLALMVESQIKRRWVIPSQVPQPTCLTFLSQAGGPVKAIPDRLN